MNDVVPEEGHISAPPNDVLGPDAVQRYQAAVHAVSFDLPPEAAALLASFPARLTEAERRIDRVLARLGIE